MSGVIGECPLIAFGPTAWRFAETEILFWSLHATRLDCAEIAISSEDPGAHLCIAPQTLGALSLGSFAAFMPSNALAWVGGGR